MTTHKSFLTYLAQAVGQYRTDRQQENLLISTPQRKRLPRLLHWLLPNGGTLLMVLILLMTQSLWARPLQVPSAPGPARRP